MEQYYKKMDCDSGQWYEPIDLEQVIKDMGYVKGGWVSVKDRLPEELVEVPIIDKYGAEEYASYYKGVPKWEDSEGYTHDAIYWYDLPPPPSEDAEKQEEKKPEYDEAWWESIKDENFTTNYGSMGVHQYTNKLLERLKAEGFIQKEGE